MRVVGHLSGGAEIIRQYKVAASVANVGVVMTGAGGGATNTEITPSAAGVYAMALGVGYDVVTFSATPAAGATAIENVSMRPDQIVRGLMTGGQTEGTALTIMTNTASSSTVVTSADANSVDNDSGTIWRLQDAGSEAPIQDVHYITAHSTSTSVTITTASETTFTTTDRFLMCPWSEQPGDGTATTDSFTHLEPSALFTEADATIASGTGAAVKIYRLICRSDTDSFVDFTLRDHAHGLAVPVTAAAAEA
tara:strand:+ start:1835 stop:2587 length:753 start_codon:yes stop_codon:yes gene_type:complete